MKLQARKIKVLLAGTVMVMYLVLSFCVFAQNKDPSVKKLNLQEKSKQTSEIQESTEEKEKTVIINVVNFGRKNPFQPYGKYDIVSGSLQTPYDLPVPPSSAADANLQEFVQSKVNGILYDPEGRSVAIINVSGTDYMMGENDSVFGYKIKNITKDEVVLKYGSNTYNVKVGDVIGSDRIHYDPVSRERPVFENTSNETSSVYAHY